MRRGCGSLEVVRVGRAGLAVVGCWCWEAERVCWWADRCRRRRVSGWWSLHREVGLDCAVVVRWRENAKSVARGSAWRLVVLVAEPFCSLVCFANTEMWASPFRLRSHPNLRAPQETPHRLRLSTHPTYQLASIIHGGEIHVPLSRLPLLSTCPYSSPLPFTTRSPSEIVRRCAQLGHWALLTLVSVSQVYS
jgi:hypothetical protein